MAAFLFAAVTACGDDSPTDPGGGGGGGGGGSPVVTTDVTVQSSLSFNPSAIQVSPGATVTWTWASGAGTHNVTFADASITDIPNQSGGAHTAVMPTAAGDYSYQCTLHSGMTGSVRVQ